MISPGRLWWLIRRDFKRGWDASYHDYKSKPRIAEWTWPFWHETPQSTPVHVLTGKNDWQLCAWMLASWFHFTEETWTVIIHDDGTLPGEARVLFQHLLKTARIISRPEADARMEKVLAAHPRCREYRNRHPLGLKIFDFAAFTEGDRFIALDSDVLFFRYPPEIMEWTSSSAQSCWFNEDVAEGSLISKEDAASALGVTLWPRVNSGLCLVAKAAIDLSLCEKALGEKGMIEGHIWRVEQTLFALCASKFGKGGLLPKTYEVSLGEHSASPDLVARHYVGAVRDRFYGEGLKRLRDVLLTDEED
jgi:hypothetical protein